MSYELLAADMDGTLLNSRKELSAENAEAIRAALECGKQVVFATGRCIGELEAFLGMFEKMRYVLCESGACVYDWMEKRAIYAKRFEAPVAREIVEYVRGRDIMPQILLDNRSVMNERDMERLEHFRMKHYLGHFLRTGALVRDAYAECAQRGYRPEKICLYHTSPESRAETARALEHLPVVMALAEETSLELSPIGVDKGTSLERLCTHLGLPLARTIAVGDSFNDLSMLQKAGLAVAVDNAVAEVKEVCQASVASCDQHGVREAIERFLLA